MQTLICLLVLPFLLFNFLSHQSWYFEEPVDDESFPPNLFINLPLHVLLVSCKLNYYFQGQA